MGAGLDRKKIGREARVHLLWLHDSDEATVGQGDGIVHPAAWLYYVNADNQRLFDAVETGFDRALADGSYAQLLEQRFFTPWLKKTLDFPNRRIIYVSTPLGDSLRQQVPGQYWLLPWERFERGEIKTGRDLCGYPVLEKLCKKS